MKLGLIAGNGKFPFLVLEGAERAGASVAVAAIREETDPDIERVAERVTWVGIGQLGKMLRFFKAEASTKRSWPARSNTCRFLAGPFLMYGC